MADSGPLIALAKCHHLTLLPKIFAEIHLPEAVLREVTGNSVLPGALAVAEFVRQSGRVHPDRNDDFYRDFRIVLDEGESQAMSLARALQCGILLDDRRGRLIAAEQGIPLFGLLGVLLEAKRLGLIEVVSPIVDNLLANDYRLSVKLIAAVLYEAGEYEAE